MLNLGIGLQTHYHFITEVWVLVLTLISFYHSGVGTRTDINLTIYCLRGFCSPKLFGGLCLGKVLFGSRIRDSTLLDSSTFTVLD